MKSLNAYVCLFLIMIDVKLTSVVFGGLSTYLYEWVDGMHD